MDRKSEKQKYIYSAEPVLQRLASAGFEGFLVGGCVREALRAELSGEEVGTTDLDITTNALPEQVYELFADMPVVETGLKHGTVTVLVPGPQMDPDAPEPMELDPAAPDREHEMTSPDPEHEMAGGTLVEFSLFGRLESAPAGHRIPIEITTYRVDGEYSDGRHPDQVRFVTSLEEDLARRDFTVNAMAMDLQGEVRDPFGGREDLKAGIIRAVGDPETRFREDGLRILRALRFAAVLDFQIEPGTEEALFTCKELLSGISAERVFTELKKLVCGPAAGDVVRKYVDILAVVIPELAAMKGFDQKNPYHNYDVLEHCIRAMEEIRPGKDYMKLAALLHDVGKPLVYTLDENGIGHFYGHPGVGAELGQKIMERLKADRFMTDRVTTLIRYHDLVFQEDDRLLKRWMNRYTPEVLQEILAIKRADNIATGNVSQELLDKFDRIKDRIDEILLEAESGQACFSLKDLAIGGRDLLEMGIPQSPEIGAILQDLLEKVIDGELPNERAALMEAAGGSGSPNSTIN